MDIRLDTLLSNEIIDPGKITEVLCEGVCIWKGLSDDVEALAEKYNFIGFDHSERGCFNKPEYVINVSKKSLLTESKGDDPEYGVPEEKKFPLNSRDHVKSAIKFFNYVKPEHEEELAAAIITKMDKYGISKESVGEKNRLSTYLTEEIKEWSDMTPDEQKSAKEDGSLFYMGGVLHVISPSGYAVPALSKDEPKKPELKKKFKSLKEDTDILNNLRSDIQGELTAIKDYSSHADAAEEKGLKDVAAVLRDISKEEKVHCGELQAVLDKHDSENKKAFEDGEEEAKDVLEEFFSNTAVARYAKMKEKAEAEGKPLKSSNNPMSIRERFTKLKEKKDSGSIDNPDTQNDVKSQDNNKNINTEPKEQNLKLDKNNPMTESYDDEPLINLFKAGQSKKKHYSEYDSDDAQYPFHDVKKMINDKTDVADEDNVKRIKKSLDKNHHMAESYDVDNTQENSEDEWNPKDYPIMNDGDGKGDYYLDGEEKVYKPKPEEEQKKDNDKQEDQQQESVNENIINILRNTRWL